MRAKRVQAFRFAASALLALGLVAADTALAASILPTGNARSSVRARAGYANGPTIVESEPTIDTLDLPPFDERVEASESTAGASASAASELRSSFGATRIEAAGSAEGSATASPALLSNGLGDTLFRFEFSVDEATRYDLSIQLGASAASQEGPDPVPFVQVSFNQGAPGTVWELQTPGQERFGLSGVLEPGVFYFLSANAVANDFAGGMNGAASQASSASFAVTLALPEPRLAGWAVAAALGAGLLRGGSRRRPLQARASREPR